jgi:hypothetical protein
MSNLNDTMFADYEVPDDVLCLYIYETIIEAINQSTSSTSIPDSIDNIHMFVDTMLMLLADAYQQSMLIEYNISYDNDKFIFNAGNVFTQNVAVKMKRVHGTLMIGFLV